MALDDNLTRCERELYEAAIQESREARSTFGTLLTLRAMQSIAHQRAHHDGDRACRAPGCTDSSCSWAPELRPGCNVVGRTGRAPNGGTYPKIEAAAPALRGAP